MLSYIRLEKRGFFPYLIREIDFLKKTIELEKEAKGRWTKGLTILFTAPEEDLGCSEELCKK